MSNETAIAALLEKGLGAYGQGQLDKAVESWNRVLEMEPSNQTALDYLESAGFSIPYKDNVIELTEHRPTSLADELKALLKVQKYSEALKRLLSAKRDSPQDASLGRAIRRVKDKYIVVLVRDLGKLDQTVTLTTARNVLEELNLSEDTQTIVGLIDGESSIGDIIHSSVLEKHTTLKALVELRARGLIQLKSSDFSLPMAVAGSRGQEVSLVAVSLTGSRIRRNLQIRYTCLH